MRLVWVVIPLILIGIVGIQESFSEDDDLIDFVDSTKNPWFSHHPDVKKPNPKLQLENGVEPTDIVCRYTHLLIYKLSNHYPTCVRHENVNKLIQRGWGTLGESLLVITTDKKQYKIGEHIFISMKNEGESVLSFHGSPKFRILNQTENYIFLPLKNVVPPFDAIIPFSPNSEISLIWNQIDRRVGQVNPGNYTVETKYDSPVMGTYSNYLGAESKITRINFEIIYP